MSTPLSREQDDAFVAGMLAGVSGRFAHPTDEWPSARCVNRPTLVHELGRLRDQLAIPGFRTVSATAMLSLLERGGVVRPVPLEQLRRGLPPDRLYAIGLGVDPEALDPVEILQGQTPRGVVCYFTALQIHELTTQAPTHHHVALLEPPTNDDTAATSATAVDATSITREQGIPPLGTLDFVFQGLPYYTTRREAHRVLGVQQRYLNERTRYRVTTLEQTLLDTLHRPYSAGGPAVVFEAWQRGVVQLNPRRLAELLVRINDPRLARRVGYMLEHFEYAAPSLLETALTKSVATLPPSTGMLALIPGVPEAELNHRWGIAAP